MGYSPMELAEVFLKTGELDDALEALNRQIDSHPDDATAKRLRAAVYSRLPGDENLRRALSDLNSLPEPTSEDYTQQSVIYERMGNYPDAISTIEKAINLALEDERLVERHVMLLIASGKLEQAHATIANQARTWRWLQWEADVLMRLGDYPSAIQRYGLALSQMDGRHFLKSNQTIQAMRGRMLIARAHAYREVGQFLEAETHYKMATEYIHDDPMITFNLGVLYALKGQTARAIEKCQTAFNIANNTLQQIMRESLAKDERLTDLNSQLNYH